MKRLVVLGLLIVLLSCFLQSEEDKKNNWTMNTKKVYVFGGVNSFHLTSYGSMGWGEVSNREISLILGFGLNFSDTPRKLITTCLEGNYTFSKFEYLDGNQRNVAALNLGFHVNFHLTPKSPVALFCGMGLGYIIKGSGWKSFINSNKLEYFGNESDLCVTFDGGFKFIIDKNLRLRVGAQTFITLRHTDRIGVDEDGNEEKLYDPQVWTTSLYLGFEYTFSKKSTL